MENQLPARREDADGLMAKWDIPGLSSNFNLQTSLPSDSPEHRLMVLSILEADSRPMSELIGQEIYFGDYIFHPVELENPDTGEIAEGIRTVLIQPEGLPVACVSVGVLQSIKRIVSQMRSLPPYDPPVKVRVIQKTTRQGRRTFKLAPVVTVP